MKRVALLAGLLVLTFGCRGEKAPAQTVDPPLKETAKEEALPRSPAWWDSENHGKPLNTDINGVMCFRGNPQRNYVGEGPIPTGNLSVLWRHLVGGVPSGHWSGVGWTGQPLIVEWPASTRRWMNFTNPPGPDREIICGALDGQVHFLDADTGEPSRPPLPMPYPYPIKGTVSVDPRGYPLLFVGCGIPVGKLPGYRVFSLLDFRELLVLPGNDRDAPRHWVGSDSNALILKDTFFEPTENGLFYKIKLNATWDADTGKLGFAPKIQKVVLTKEGCEGSMAVWNDLGYVTDNLGVVREIDLNDPAKFRTVIEMGDDCDSSPVFLKDGTFVMGVEKDTRLDPKAKGAICRIDPQQGKALWRWEFDAGKVYGERPLNGGVLSTAGLYEPEDGPPLVFFTTSHHPKVGRGFLLALNAETGKLVWKHPMRAFGWSSPICVGGVVFAADSTGAAMVRDAKTGESLLTDAEGKKIEFMELGANVESSPIVWHGRIYVGLRGGAIICIGQKA